VETGVHASASIFKQVNRIGTEVNVLTSFINYANGNQIIADAGASAKYEGRDFSCGLHFGRVTSRPDIRGLPDQPFRMSLNRTYISSVPFFLRGGMVTKFGIEPYVRYCSNAPQLDPIRRIWAPGQSTAMLAYGSDVQCRVVATSWLEIGAALNGANTRRQNADGHALAYEWNLPWTIRGNFHFHSKNDRWHLFVDYIRSKGLPYYDFDLGTYAPLPVYRSIDFNFQIRAFTRPQRFINKLDGYITVKNLQDLIVVTNVRDYYWDIENQRRPIYLGYGRADIGARFGIKW
jgi:hypothetical protein